VGPVLIEPPEGTFQCGHLLSL